MSFLNTNKNEIKIYLICAICNKIYQEKKRFENHILYWNKVCIVCKKDFCRKPSNHQKTCSHSCEYKEKWRIGILNKESLIKNTDT